MRKCMRAKTGGTPGPISADLARGGAVNGRPRQPAGPGSRSFTMPHWTLWLVVFISLFCLPACSDEEPPPAAGVAEQMNDAGPDSGEDEALYAEGEEGGEDIYGGPEDLGTECREHRYLLPPGVTEFLTFSVLLPVKDEERPSQFTVTSEGGDETGVDLSLFSVDYESFTESFPVWALDYSGHLAEIRTEIERKRSQNPNAGFALNLSLGIRVDNRSVMFQHDLEAGMATISRLDNATTAKQVGQLSEEEVSRALGLDSIYDTLTFRDSFLGKTVSVPLVASTADRERTIQTFTLSVTTPVDGGFKDKKTRYFLVMPSSGKATGRRFGITSDWALPPDMERIHFVISGPAESRDCYY